MGCASPKDLDPAPPVSGKDGVQLADGDSRVSPEPSDTPSPVEDTDGTVPDGNPETDAKDSKDSGETLTEADSQDALSPVDSETSPSSNDAEADGAEEEDAEIAPFLSVTAFWPRELTRGRTQSLSIRGTELELAMALVALAPQGEPPSLNIHWDKREILQDGSLLRVPITVPKDVLPRPFEWSLSGADKSFKEAAEIGLSPGELEGLIGNSDLGEVSEPTPWEESEFFQVVAVETGNGFLFLADAGWNRIFVTRVGTQGGSLLGQWIAPGLLYPLAGNGASGASVDGPALEVPLSEPKGLCFARHEGIPLLYFADTTHHQIRVLNLGDEPAFEMGYPILPGEIKTLAGTGQYGFSGDGGPASEATFFRPWRVRGCDGDVLHVGDVENYRLRSINRSDAHTVVGPLSLAPGEVGTLAGNGTLGFSGDGGAPEEAQVSIPKGMARVGDHLLVFSDPENDRLRILNLGTQPESYGGKTVAPGTVESLGFPGTFNGIESTPGFAHPTGLRRDPLDGIWVTDTYTHTVKLYNGTQSPLYRGGQMIPPGDTPGILAGIEYYQSGSLGIQEGTEAYLASPFDLAIDTSRGELFVADEENRIIRRLKLWVPWSLLEGNLGPFPSLSALPGTLSTLNTDTGVLSADGTETHHFGSRHGVFDFDSIEIPAGETLRIQGLLPAALLSKTGIQVYGTLLVEAGSVSFGPGSGIGDSGASHGTLGEGDAPGALYGNPTLVPMAGGSPGGEGAPGGGAILLAAQGSILIEGAIIAQGLTPPNGSGGGSGGSIRLVSWESIAGDGLLSAKGGGGPIPGGDGRIRLEAPEILLGGTLPAASISVGIPLLDTLPGF